RWFLSWWRTGGARGSGGCGDDHDPMERFEDLAGPGPVGGQPAPGAPAPAAEPGGDVQHLEPQQLRLDDGQVTGQGEQPQPGGQIGGDRGELQPGLGGGGPPVTGPALGIAVATPGGDRLGDDPLARPTPRRQADGDPSSPL